MFLGHFLLEWVAPLPWFRSSRPQASVVTAGQARLDAPSRDGIARGVVPGLPPSAQGWNNYELIWAFGGDFFTAGRWLYKTRR